MRIRFAEIQLRHVSEIQSVFGRRRLLDDAVKTFRARLEHLGVARDRVEAEVIALERAFAVATALPRINTPHTRVTSRPGEHIGSASGTRAPRVKTKRRHITAGGKITSRGDHFQV